MMVLILFVFCNLIQITCTGFVVYGTNLTGQTVPQDKPEADNIIVKLKPGATTEDINTILRKHPRFQLGRQFELLGIMYLELVMDKVSIPNELNTGDTIISEDDDDVISIGQEPMVDSCEIDYKMEIEIMNYDPEIDYAWYLANKSPGAVMNIDKAWRRGYTGKGVTVAVIDSQTQVNHADLTNVDVENSMNLFVPRTNEQLAKENNFHGTAVSGIIGATKGNDFCTVGVAYNVSIIAIGLLPENNAKLSTTNIIAALTHNISTVDIYTNSWGRNSKTGFLSTSPMLTAALEHGVTYGRQGKGSIYVFAAGNGGPLANSAASPFLSNIYRIVISSVEYDNVVSYGQTGSNILAVGYGGSEKHGLVPILYPIDQCSNSSGLSGSFGTSLSAPQVSGIIALALEANDGLTWRDVQHLIVRSSRRHQFKDNYYPQYQWKRNGVGFIFHPKMGFGLVDAFKMVNMAKNWKAVPEMISCTFTADRITGSSEKGKYLKGVLKVPKRDCSIRFIENILVNTKVGYSAFRGYTEIDLVSPRRTRSPLLTERSADNTGTSSAGSFTWTFRTVHFWGETMIGSWILMARSLSDYSQVGPVSWSVTFYGTTRHPRT